MNYEGSQASVSVNDQDGEFYNINPQAGWFVSNFETDLQEGEVFEFIEKENKWFNRIISRESNQPSGSNQFARNVERFTHQGIGFPLLDAPTTEEEEAVVNIIIDDDED